MEFNHFGLNPVIEEPIILLQISNVFCLGFSVNSVLIPFGISDISTTAKSVSSYTNS